MFPQWEGKAEEDRKRRVVFKLASELVGPPRQRQGKKQTRELCWRYCVCVCVCDFSLDYWSKMPLLLLLLGPRKLLLHRLSTDWALSFLQRGEPQEKFSGRTGGMGVRGWFRIKFVWRRELHRGVGKQNTHTHRKKLIRQLNDRGEILGGNTC